MKDFFQSCLNCVTPTHQVSQYRWDRNQHVILIYVAKVTSIIQKRIEKILATVFTYCLVVLSFDFVKDIDTYAIKTPFKSYGIFKIRNFLDT